MMSKIQFNSQKYKSSLRFNKIQTAVQMTTGARRDIQDEFGHEVYAESLCAG